MQQMVKRVSSSNSYTHQPQIGLFDAVAYMAAMKIMRA
jgi:hypothetical protein